MLRFTQKELLDWLRNECRGGRIFGIEFTKADGKATRRSVRLGVSKGVKGTQDRAEQDYRHFNVSFWDMNAGRRGELGYRCAKLERTRSFHVRGVKYQVQTASGFVWLTPVEKPSQLTLNL